MSVAVNNSAEDRKKNRKVFSFISLFSGLLFLISGVVMGYSPFATAFNNTKQKEANVEYSKAIADLQNNDVAKGKVAEAVLAAKKYNETLDGIPILDPFLNDVKEKSGRYAEYLKHLSDTDMMARIIVPSIGVDLPVRHGTDDATLAIGAGHVYGSALPVGTVGRTIITSHTGLPTATLFDRLVDLKQGDLMMVESYGEIYTYKVFDIKTVLPTESEYLSAVAGKDLLTLLTCTPYGINSHRLLVTGERVETTPEIKAKVEAVTDVSNISVVNEFASIDYSLKAMMFVSAVFVLFGLVVVVNQLRLLVIGLFKPRKDDE